MLEPLVFSSAWVAAAAAALLAASAQAMGSRPEAMLPGLAFCGTLVVYNVDRLRDLPRDRATSPRRSAFVAAHRTALTGITLLAAAACLALALALPARCVALLAAVLAAGLFHRRLKHFGWWKPVYVSGAWTTVVVGLPGLAVPAPRHLPWIAAILAGTFVANVIASNLRDGEAVAARLGERVPLQIALGFAAGAVLLAALSPVRPLVAPPLLTLLALAAFRPGELYGLLVVDGALLAGALLAVPLLR